MTTWLTRVERRMAELGLTQEDVADKVGLSRGAIGHYLTGRRQPPLNQFAKLAAALGVSPSWLQFGTSETEQTQQPKDLIPILSWKQTNNLRAQDEINDGEAKEYVPHFYTDQPNWYALRVNGDSMTAPTWHGKSFNEGDILIVDPEKTPTLGDFIIVIINDADEATFKQYIVDGGIHYLKPLNPQYPIIQLNKRDNIQGVVTACIRLTEN